MGFGSFFSLPMLWDSALLSLLERFTDSDIRITFSWFHPEISGAYPSSRVAGTLTQVPDRGSPFSLRAGRAFSGTSSCDQQFSCGLIDIVESMSRRVFLTAVCASPSVSFFLNFYDVMLSDFCGLSMWICMSCVTTALCPHYYFLAVAFLMLNSGISLIFIAVITLLKF